MTKLIEDIENYLNQQDYGSVITQTFLWWNKRDWKKE
jgi:hypothetical protein